MSAPIRRTPAASDALATTEAQALPSAASAFAAGRCRNCGADAPGAYCPVCGQETAVALPTARRFIREASGRLIAWDGRLWRTLAALVFQPGRLTQAYLAGRRRHYVRPARLFLAMSLILFAVIRLEIGLTGTSNLIIVDEADKATRPAGATAEPPRPPPEPPAGAADRKPADAAKGDRAKTAPSGGRDAPAGARSPGVSLNIGRDMDLVLEGPDTYVFTKLRERFQRFNRLSPDEKADQLVDGALRYGTYVAVLLLPVFAALLKIAYLGRARRYPGRPKLYAEHLVFAAHLHTFAFLALTVAVVVPWGFARFAIAAWAIYYAFRAQKVVYGGGAWGRIVRDALIALAYLVVVSLGVAGLVAASIVLR